MKHILFALLLATTCSNMYGQDSFCHSKRITKATERTIKNLSEKDYQIIKLSKKDSVMFPTIFMAYERKERNLKPIYNYLRSKGCYTYYVDQLHKIIREYTYYKIYEIDTCLSNLLQPYLDRYFEGEKKCQQNMKADSIKGVYIPTTLDECFIQIDSLWSDSLKILAKELSENDWGTRVHSGFGRWMRNNWGLWNCSRLRTYFNNLEIYHPDDMSSIILVSYHRYLNSKDINLNEQLRIYHTYWDKVKAEEERERKWWKFKTK